MMKKTLWLATLLTGSLCTVSTQPAPPRPSPGRAHRRHRSGADRQRDHRRAGRQIVAAGPAARVAVPAGAERVSLAGKTVIPGLINAHGTSQPWASRAGKYSAETVLKRSAHLRRLRRDDGLLARRGTGGRVRRARSAEHADARSRPPVRRRSGDRAENARRGAHAGRRRRGDEGRHRQDPRRRQSRHHAEDAAGGLPGRDRRGAQEAACASRSHLFYLDDAKAVLEAGADFIAHSIRDTEVDAAVDRDAEATQSLRTARR